MTQHASNHPTFAEVAHLIAPNNTPIWLPAYLEWSSQGLRYDQLVEEIRQTKAKTKERLEAFQEASLLILRELGAPVRDFLEIDPLGPIKNTSELNVGLMDLAKRAEFAAASPLISQADGTTKPGRNKAMAPGHFSAKTLCAARILDAFVHFRGSEPGPRNLEAADAAEAFWLASGGPSKSFGNPLTGWRHHFETVKINEKTLASARLRAVWRRDLRQAERKGGPSWYIGTYYPIEKPAFMSTSKEQ